MGTQWGQKWGQSAAATSGREGESARLAKRFGAGGGTRTLTGGKPHRILSPARLPVSPLRHMGSVCCAPLRGRMFSSVRKHATRDRRRSPGTTRISSFRRRGRATFFIRNNVFGAVRIGAG